MNGADETIGYVDAGHATLRDKNDSHFASIGKDGSIRDHLETDVGRIEGFASFHELRRVAAYVFYFDQAIVQTNLPSLVHTATSSAAPVAVASSSAPTPSQPSQAAPPASSGSSSGVDARSLDYGLEDQSLSKEEERLLKHVGSGASRLGKPANPPAQTKPAPAPAPTNTQTPTPAPAPEPLVLSPQNTGVCKIHCLAHLA